MSGLWFRIYRPALNDPRLQRLPASLFRAWFNVLCAASRNGGALPDLPELAFMLRTRPGALSRRLEALKRIGAHRGSGRRATARRMGEAAIRRAARRPYGRRADAPLS